MFTELYAVAKHTPLSIVITPRGEQLSVIVTPRPDKDDIDKGSALATPLQFVGTPEELDRELPAALAQYTGKVNDIRLKLDMPIEALDAEAAKAGKKTAKKIAEKKTEPANATQAKPEKKAAKKRPVAKVKRAAKPAATKPKVKAAKKPAGVPKSKPAAKKTSAKKSAPKNDESNRHSAEECLFDVCECIKAAEAKGKKFTREVFLNANKTGRSYERKWKSWQDFITLAKRVLNENRGKLTEISPGVYVAALDVVKKTVTSKPIVNPAGPWPFAKPPTENPAPQATGSTPPVAKTRTVHSDGRLLGNTTDDLDLGDKFTHADLGDFRVFEVTDDRILVEPWPADANASAEA